MEPWNADEWQQAGRKNEIALTLDQVRSHTRRVIEGTQPAMFVFGGSGLGKNYIVEDCLRRYGRDKGANISVTPKVYHDVLNGFHKATHRRRTPLPLVFDEAELIFKTVQNVNILKMATDRTGRRFYPDFTWWDEEYREDGEGTKKVARKGTSLKAPIIAMTNKNLHDFPRDMKDHAEALFSRVPPIMIPTDPLVAWEYVVWLALTTDLLTHHRGNSVPLIIRSEAIEWFTSNLHDLPQVSVRMMTNILDVMVTRNLSEVNRDLDLLLKPSAQRCNKRGPQSQDWMRLRINMA